MTTEDDASRDPAKRHIGKQEAARHLIHGAVRLFIAAEDPFIIHVLVKAAERILLDIAKHRGVTLPLDLNLRVRPEKRAYVHQRLNETYNFLKHADRDSDDEVPVHDLPRLNAVLLLMVIHHYISLFHETTSHMMLHIFFMYAALPGIFTIPEPSRVAFEEAMKGIADMTPIQFFSTVETVKALFAPQFDEEKARDTSDGRDYYDTPFSQLDEPG